MKVFTPLTPVERCRWNESSSIFLAGSIDMDNAPRWQDRVLRRFKDEDVVFLNPRRDDWDNTISQSAEDPLFVQQVTWELEMLDAADLIIMNFSPLSRSPISLLELGLFSTKPMVVCCPEGFYRKGNVDIVCERFGILRTETFKDLLDFTENWIRGNA